MAKRKRKPDPIVPFSEEYIWVKTRESSFWRRKRGTVRPATLNKSFQENVSHAKVAGPAAVRLLGKLHPYMLKMAPGRITLRICNLFIKTLNQKGKMDFSLFRGLDLQEKYPIDKLLPAHKLIEEDDEVTVTIPIDQHTLRSVSPLVTHYYFELILLHGDPAKEKSLRTESTISALYPFIKNPKKSLCTLTMTLPSKKNPWMVLLKLNCHEGSELAAHPRHYPMRVVAVG